MNCTRIAGFLIASTFIPTAAWSAVTSIVASKDNSIFQSAVSNSAGGSAGIFSGANANGSPRRGLIAFDVAGNVPPGSLIIGTQLTLYLGNAGGSALPQPIGIHRLTADWGEGTAGSSTPTVGGSGNGFAASTGDATWNQRFFGSTNWSNPGATGDFVTAPSATTIVGNTLDTAHHWFPLSTTMRNDVQGWLDNPSSNFGWALINANETTGGSVRAFYSRSATQNSTGGTLNPAFRPTLTITYVPEPSTALLLLLAGPLAIARRQR
jgi:hypothetical protein